MLVTGIAEYCPNHAAAAIAKLGSVSGPGTANRMGRPQVKRMKALLATAASAAAVGCAAAPAPDRSPARDGTFEFAVVGTSEAQFAGDPADPALSVAAKGIFVVVTLSVRNVGAEARTFVDSDQTLVDERGRRFPVSRAANIYANLDVPSTRIAPGDAVVVDLAFDVPPGTVPTSLVLRGSASSGGVTVPLS